MRAHIGKSARQPQRQAQTTIYLLTPLFALSQAQNARWERLQELAALRLQQSAKDSTQKQQ
ncbi:unnamed protein product, partial [Ceratitis capitata]